jgi:8-oxo-dGTP pyrophosphatase MutT (NUDIX family)
VSEDVFHLGIKALIRNDAGEVLILQINPNMPASDNGSYWDLPGGRIQEGEVPLEALKREVAEETGITTIQSATHLGMALSNIRIPVSATQSVGLVLSIYECTVSGLPPILISEEHSTYSWLPAAQAAKLLEIKFPKELCKLIEAQRS